MKRAVILTVLNVTLLPYFVNNVSLAMSSLEAAVIVNLWLSHQ